MRISEFEYHVISELITMADRDLAQQIELDIWRYGPSPDKKRLQLYVEAMKDSEDPPGFHEKCRELVKDSGIEFIPPDGVTADEAEKMGGRRLHIKATRTKPPEDYRQQLIEGENFEGK